MSQRFLAVSAVIAACFLLTGLLVVDVPLVLAIHQSAFESLPFFVGGLNFFDTILGMHVWYWLAATACVALGLIGILLSRTTRLSRDLALAICSAGLVQALSLTVMIAGKNTFGRLRPMQLLESGDWSAMWFVGGGSFPSGHGAFYFGLFLPLAAAAPRAWQRVVLIGIPLFAVLARLDTAKHFLSDVSCSALIAACMALLVSQLMKRWTPEN